MRTHIESMLHALATDPIWLAWCRDNLGGLPKVCYEPKLPEEGVPDDAYPFAWLYDARVSGANSCTIELAVGIIDKQGHSKKSMASTLEGASVLVDCETCTGLLLALQTWQAAANCLYRLRLGVQHADGESGSAVLHPYYESWGSISASWGPLTRKPLGR